MSQVQKMVYTRYVAVHVWLGKGDMLGMLADVQASGHDSTAHVQRFSHLNEEADDCDAI